MQKASGQNVSGKVKAGKARKLLRLLKIGCRTHANPAFLGVGLTQPCKSQQKSDFEKYSALVQDPRAVIQMLVNLDDN